MKVFVYGTLKRGHRNNALLADATFVGEGVTVAKCRLLHAGFPVLRPRSKKDGPHNAPVTGEVYEIDAATLERLDRLEGNGRMYHRMTKRITLANGRQVLAFAYVGDGRFWLQRSYPPPSYIPDQGRYTWPAKTQEDDNAIA